jgi:hypothetical protein
MGEGEVYPVFVFDRRHDIELETNIALAGSLFVERRHEQRIPEFMQQIIEMARSGQMPTNALLYGWDGGRKPINAVDTKDDALMAAWVKDCLSIRVRIDPRIKPREGIFAPFDSELLADIGLASNAPEKEQ